MTDSNTTANHQAWLALLGFFPPVWLVGIVILVPIGLALGLLGFIASKALGFLDVVDFDAREYAQAMARIPLWPWYGYKRQIFTRSS